MMVFINAGHAPNGHPDPGACSRSTGLRECDVALKVGELVAKYLNVVGIETMFIRMTACLRSASGRIPWRQTFSFPSTATV